MTITARRLSVAVLVLLALVGSVMGPVGAGGDDVAGAAGIAAEVGEAEHVEAAGAVSGHRFPLGCGVQWYSSTYVGHGQANGTGSGPPTRYSAIDLNMAGGNNDRGRAVYATADGTVIARNNSNGEVTIRHASGNRSRFAHMQNIRVSVGQRVTRGQQIGQVGSVGAGGAHLHFELLTSSGGPRHIAFFGRQIRYAVTGPNGPAIPRWWCTG